MAQASIAIRVWDLGLQMINREEYFISKLNSNYIGDDGAIVGDKIYSMDTFFEGVHFQRGWMTPGPDSTKQQCW